MSDELRSVSASDAKRVLKRAAELDVAKPIDAVSLSDLRSAASEAGFTQENLDRAIAETLRRFGSHEESVVVKRGVLLSKFVVSLSMRGNLSDAEIRQVAALNTPYAEREPSVYFDDHGGVWKDRRGFRFELLRLSGGMVLKVSSPRLLGIKGPFERRASRAIRRLEAIASFVAAASAARR